MAGVAPVLEAADQQGGEVDLRRRLRVLDARADTVEIADADGQLDEAADFRVAEAASAIRA
jgi:hypothetical protein